MFHTTSTRPRPLRKRKLLEYRAACAAGFGRRKKPIHRYDVSSVPASFVFKLAEELGPGCIGDTFRQLPVFQHAAHVERLNADRLVFTNQPSRELVLKISSRICDLRMRSRYADTGLPPVGRPRLPAAKCPLLPGEVFLRSPEMPGILNLLARGKRREVCNPDVDANTPVGFRNRRNRLPHKERHMPSAGRVKRHSHSARVASKFSRPPDFKRSFHFRERKLAAARMILKTGARKRCRSTRSFLFSRRMSRRNLRVQKILETNLQVSQRLLKGDTRNLIKPFVFWIFFKLSKL